MAHGQVLVGFWCALGERNILGAVSPPPSLLFNTCQVVRRKDSNIVFCPWGVYSQVGFHVLRGEHRSLGVGSTEKRVVLSRTT